MNRALSQISVSLPVDSGLFPNHLAEDKFAKALRLALSDIYQSATIVVEWNYRPATNLTHVDGRDSSDEGDDVVDVVCHMRELWQLVWEAVTGSLDQAGKLGAQ